MATLRVTSSTRRGFVQLTHEIDGRQYWKLTQAADKAGISAAELLDRFIESVAGDAPEPKTGPNPVDQGDRRVSMKPRERLARYSRIAELTAEGVAVAEIAREVGMTPQGVYVAIRNIRRDAAKK